MNVWLFLIINLVVILLFGKLYVIFTVKPVVKAIVEKFIEIKEKIFKKFYPSENTTLNFFHSETNAPKVNAKIDENN